MGGAAAAGTQRWGQPGQRGQWLQAARRLYPAARSRLAPAACVPAACSAAVSPCRPRPPAGLVPGSLQAPAGAQVPGPEDTGPAGLATTIQQRVRAAGIVRRTGAIAGRGGAGRQRHAHRASQGGPRRRLGLRLRQRQLLLHARLLCAVSENESVLMQQACFHSGKPRWLPQRSPSGLNYQGHGATCGHSANAPVQALTADPGLNQLSQGCTCVPAEATATSAGPSSPGPAAAEGAAADGAVTMATAEEEAAAEAVRRPRRRGRQVGPLAGAAAPWSSVRRCRV